MTQKILVAYATKHRSTADIASSIGEVLRDEGFPVDVRPVESIGGLTPYDVVIVGSAVYLGRWLPTGARFIRKHQDALANRLVWLFSSGPLGEGDPVELLDGWEFPPLLQGVAHHIQPEDMTVFHGRVDEFRINKLEKLVLDQVEAPIDDFRDWQAITDWAKSIAAQLSTEVNAG